MRRVFGELVTLGEGTPDTRRRVSAALLGDDEEVRAAVDLLASARLLTYDYDPITREPTVEIARRGPAACLATVAGMDRRRPRRAARPPPVDRCRNGLESNGRDPDRLYRGSRLDEALELATQPTGRLDAVESEFLVESRSRAHAETRRAQRRNRVVQTLLASVAVLMFVAIVAGLVAVDQRDDARAACVASEVDRMAAEAPGRAGSDPRLALLMAAEAHALADSAEGLGALQRTLLATGTDPRLSR